MAETKYLVCDCNGDALSIGDLVVDDIGDVYEITHLDKRGTIRAIEITMGSSKVVDSLSVEKCTELP